MSDSTFGRRRLLEATGSVAVLALAGCTSTSAPNTDGSGGNAATTTDHEHEEDDHESTATETTRGDPDHDHHGDHHHEDIPDEPQSHAEVRMITQGDGYHFSPHVVWLEEGGTVTFVNESGSHSATAYAPANDKPRRIPEGGNAFDTGLRTEQGATDEFTFETPGVYDYYCIPHETVGMIGSIIVGEPDAHDQPGLSEPSAVSEATHEKIRGLNDTANRALGHTHDESETTESGEHEADGHDDGGHHEEETTESGHHEEDSHHEEETTESGQHEEGGHDDGGHHEEETTESGHHDGGGHHEEETTESGHHDDGHHG